MQFVPMTRKLVLEPHLRSLRRMGAPVERLLHQSGLSRAIESSSSALIPHSNARDFYLSAVRTVGAEKFHWETLLNSDLVSLQPGLSAFLQRFPTPASALPCIQMCSSLTDSAVRSWAVPRGNTVWVCAQFPDCIRTGRRLASAFALLGGIKHIQLAAGDEWWPEKILLESAPIPCIAELEVLTGTQVYFSQSVNAFSVPQKLLSLPWNLDRLCTTEWDPKDVPSHDLPRSIEQFIRWKLPDGPPDIVAAADVAGMSVRSLQRALSAHALTYSTILDRIRFELACEGLRTRGQKVIELALDLGFSDSANFTRAFRRWTGISPREWRSIHAT